MGVPSELPYTVASLPFRGELTEGNAEKLKIPLDEQRPVMAEERDSGKVNIRHLDFLHIY